MLMYARLLLYTVLSFRYGQVKLQDIHLTCPQFLLNGTQINLTCTVSTSYSSKCAVPVDIVLFRYTYDENVYYPSCTTGSVNECDFNQTLEDCGCVHKNNTHYTLKYTFIASVRHNITWDCFINCLDDRLNPALTFESKFCRRRNIESRNVFQGSSNGDQSLDTGLIIGIAVGAAVAVVTICVVIVLLLMLKEKILSKLKRSDIETPVHIQLNENQEEAEKHLSTPVQKKSESKENLEMKEIEYLSKPVQEETESIEEQEETDKLLSTSVESETESKKKLEKKDIKDLSKLFQEQTESKKNLEKKEIKDLSKPFQEQTESN